MKSLNVLFVGIGSIAKRHIANLGKICEERGLELNVDCFRSSKRPLDGVPEGSVRNVFYDAGEIKGRYDAVFITNPTGLHLEAIKTFGGFSDHFFVEKPVCGVGQDFSAVKDIVNDSGRVFYVACPLRYTNVIRYIKENIDFSRVCSLRSISSSNLAEWRPGTDYRNTYSAHKALGGGVSIDLIHEWDYIYYLIGKPKNVKSFIKKISPLETDSDDIAVYIAEYDDKIAEVHLDYFGRKPVRKVELFTFDDTIEGDLIESRITYRKSGKIIDFSEERNDYQIRELEYFLSLIRGEAVNTNDITTAFDILNTAKGEI